MKNLIIFGNYFEKSIGGMESHLKYLVEFFKVDSDWSCHFIVFRENELFILYDLKNNEDKNFTSIKELALSLFNKFNETNYCFFFNDGRWIDYLAVLRSQNKKAVFCQRTGGNEFMKAPLINSDSNSNKDLSTRQKIWAKIINENLDFIISNSSFTNSRLRQIGVEPQKIKLIRGGVDRTLSLKNLSQKKKLRNDFITSHSIKQKYILVAVSRFTAFKGLDYLIQGVNLSRYKNDIFLLLAGDGELKSQLEELCREKLAKDSYLFPGSVSNEEALEYIALSDLYCSTSINYYKISGNEKYLHTETMGRSILEAICQNTCVLATNTGGVSEWFENGDNIGKLAGAEDANEIASAIDSLIECGFKIDNAALKYLNRYSWESVFENYKSILREKI